MSDIQRETLSAGMDGELSEDQWRFLLRRLDHDAALMQAWTRYHVVRDGLRGQLTTVASAQFADKVILAMEQGALVADGKRRHWLRWSAGGAIAASVAVVALMMTGPAGPGGNQIASRQMGAVVSSVGSPAQVKTTDNHDAQIAHFDAPAVVPPWVSASSVLPLSQGASATFDTRWQALPYSRGELSAYPLQRYRLGNDDQGYYLLLISPNQQAQGSAAAQ